MKQARFAQKVYQAALNLFKSYVFVYLNYLINEIKRDLTVSQYVYEIKVHVISLDVNADNNLGFGGFVYQLVTNSALIDRGQRDVQLPATYDVLILDQPSSAPFFQSLFAAMEERRRSTGLIVLSTLLPRDLQALIFKALYYLYEQFNYFPRLSFWYHALECSFDFQDIVRLIVPRAALSAEFVEGSTAIPLFRAQFYPNNVRMTLMEALPAASESQTRFLEFCTKLKNNVYIDFAKLLVAFERGERITLGDYYTQIGEFHAEQKQVFRDIYHNQNTAIVSPYQMLQEIQRTFVRTPNGAVFYDFGQFNFKGFVIAQLCKQRTSLISIVFNMIHGAASEIPVDLVFNKYFKYEGRRFSSVEKCLEEFESVLTHLAEYGMLDLHLVQGNAMIIRKF